MKPWAASAVAAGCMAATAAAAQPAKLTSGQGPSLTLRAAAFAHSGSDPADLGRLFGGDAYVAGLGPTARTDGAVRLRTRGAAVDSLRISIGGVLRAPGGVPFNLNQAEFDGRDYEVALTRDWPAAVRVGAGPFDLDVTPHAGVGVSTAGGLAEAGATLRLGPSRDEQAVRKLRDLGVGDGASFGEQGRWYLFMAASGRAVGLNVLRSDEGWNRAGWSTDPSSALIGDAQLGVGWRRGAMQSSLGYVHREIKGAHMVFGQQTRSDSLLAFTLSVKPGR